MTPKQIGKLTMRQIWGVYFHARDKHGEIRIDWDSGDEPGHEDQFIAEQMKAGLSRRQAKEKYREYWAIESERCRLVEGGTSAERLREQVVEFERQMVKRRVWR